MAAQVVSVALPKAAPAIQHGIRIYLATPRLRGLLALNLAVAASSAMVIVNTAVLLQARFGLSQHETAQALATFGGGLLTTALALPRLLQDIADRRAMLSGAGVLEISLLLRSLLNSYV
ncbi:hypothetical protein B0T40_13605 [Chromobacterium haemolyticum]|nr:hypothetical protein B0T40_13605 [Chromobacterium haemolyticum]